MDQTLRTLADAGLALDAAEEALEAGEATVAQEQLAIADDALTAVRAAWPDLPRQARTVVGPAGRDVKERHDALLKRVPRRRALSQGTPEKADPDEDTPPDEG